MNPADFSKGLTYSDVALVPQFSEIKHRSDVDVSVRMGPLEFAHPIIVANMKSLMALPMAQAIYASGGLPILHRFDPLEEQDKKYHNVDKWSRPNSNRASISVGVDKESLEAITFWFLETNVNIITIDIAHGDSKQCIDMIKYIRGFSEQWNPFIIAGNVATREGAKHLWMAGADCVKVGISNGGICSTFVETGYGVPMLSALHDIWLFRRGAHYADKYIIADGGIRSSGDIVKALCWSDMVMCGGLFAGCNETQSETKIINGIRYQSYDGSSTYKGKNVEGVKGWVKHTGTYQERLTELLDGIRSGCSYGGCRNIQELQGSQDFIEISNQSLTLLNPHDILVTND